MTSTSRGIEYASGGSYCYELVDAAETCAWWLIGERQYLDDPVYGVVPPIRWLRTCWLAWLVRGRPCK